MLTISIWQPHATLVMLGVKPYETRSWAVYKSLLGQRIGIHAAKAMDDLKELEAYIGRSASGVDSVASFDAMRAALHSGGFEKLADLPRGCVIGSAVLQACVRTEDLADPGYFGDFSSGRFAWRLVDPVPLPEPVPYRGQQGFFTVPDDVFGGARSGVPSHPGRSERIGSAIHRRIRGSSSTPDSAMTTPGSWHEYLELRGQMRLIP